MLLGLQEKAANPAVAAATAGADRSGGLTPPSSSTSPAVAAAIAGADQSGGLTRISPASPSTSPEPPPRSKRIVIRLVPKRKATFAATTTTEQLPSHEEVRLDPTATTTTERRLDPTAPPSHEEVWRAMRAAARALKDAQKLCEAG